MGWIRHKGWDETGGMRGDGTDGIYGMGWMDRNGMEEVGWDRMGGMG